jgi:xanthine dehydrogenase accessory factor
MLVTDAGTVVGSVSGGCVEGAVYELAQKVLAGGQPTLQRYGFSDDDAFAVGLTCGGILDIFVEPISADTFPDYRHVAADVEAGRPVAVATVIEHPYQEWIGRRLSVRPGSSTGNLGSAGANRAVSESALGMLATGRTGTVTMGPDGERLGAGMKVFIASFVPRARMLVFGAIDFAAALARQGPSWATT